MTETIQQLKEDIAILQEKLRKLEEQDPEMLLLRQGKVDFVDYDGKKYIRIEYTDSFADEYNWYVRRVGEDAIRPVRDVNVYAPLEELYQKEVLKQKDDYPYKIADEHGELNPYKQYLNSVEDEKKMEELGFVKNSDGSWTARPLGETAPEEVKKLQEKEWNIKVVTDYLTGKSRHKLNIVDKDGNDYKPEPITTEELLKPKWEPKPQTHEEVADGLKKAFREAIKQGIIPEVDKVSDEFMDEMVAKLKGQTLRDVCMEWWSDVFTTEYDWDDETSIQDLISRIEEWLPKPQNADGSQNAYVESAVEGFNDCLNTIKRKLR